MHRSGTSVITRAINLLGVYLGKDAKVSGCGADNPEGFWEHSDICAFHERVFGTFNRRWDTTKPIPTHWQQSDEIRPFRKELKNLIADNFAGHPLWGWKDPRTCLLLPLWRDVLEEMGTKLLCVFVVRNPQNVANSLIARDAIPVNEALGLWFYHCITALKDCEDLPTAFIDYDRFLMSWAPELQRCGTILGLDWAVEEQKLGEEMSSFIQPALRHNRRAFNEADMPKPVLELYSLLHSASRRTSDRDEDFNKAVNRLCEDFHSYSSFFEGSKRTAQWPALQRFIRRWQKSFTKRINGVSGKKKAAPFDVTPAVLPAESRKIEILAINDNEPLG